MSRYIWSGVVSTSFKGSIIYKIAAFPVSTMSWPAHEKCLVISGVGYGANASTPATFWPLMVFMGQVFLTWSLLLIPTIMQKKILP